MTIADQVASWLVDFGPVLFYLAVWILVFAGTAVFAGVIIPFLTGDSLLFGAGLVAGTSDQISIWVLAIGVGIAAFAGDQVGFVLGRHFGRPYLTRRRGKWIAAGVRRAERFYELFGWWSVVVARYVPWGRVFIPPVAGVAGMAYWRFLTANIVGAFTWGIAITLIGYWAASNPEVRTVSYVIAGVVILGSVFAGVRAWRMDRSVRASAASVPSVPGAPQSGDAGIEK
jgi:membrane-associated protein